jgi:pilus assembly protein Flp/PilA
MERRARRFSSREVLLIRQTLSLIGAEVGSDYKNGHFSGRLNSSGERNGRTPCVRISSLFGRFEPIWRLKIITGRIRPMLKLATAMLKDLMNDESGQDLVEYALLLVFIALAAIAVLPVLGKAVNNVFSQSASTLTTGS